MEWEDLVFNVCSFVSGLFLLEWGADKFIDHTVVVAKRLGVSPALVSLLTAGAEWEELAVIVAAVSQKRSNLALGNVLGSSISNILGAFALGLIFSSGTVTFDRSSKIYTAVLLGVTTLFAIFLAFYNTLKNIAGPFLILLFGIYVASIGYGIYRGIMAPPEDSDSDSDTGDSDSDSDSDYESTPSDMTLTDRDSSHSLSLLKNPRQSSDEESLARPRHSVSSNKSAKFVKAKPKILNKRPKTLRFHILRLILGFLSLTVSCYVLSHSIASIGDDLGLDNSVVGITILSLATTLPEKFVAIIGGAKGQSGIIVANTAGSNIFLLTLCAGILFISGDREAMANGYNLAELAIMWLSSAALCGFVFIGANKRVGEVLLVLYVIFLVSEIVFSGGRD